MTTIICEDYPIKSSVSLTIRSKSTDPFPTTSVELIEYSESLDIPETYSYLLNCPITTSTDICAYICAWKKLTGPLKNKLDIRIIPPLFCYYRNEINFSELLGRIKKINDEIDSESEITNILIAELEEISFEKHENNEQIIKRITDLLTEKTGGPLFDSNLLDEIKVPDDPILVSDIKWVSFRCRNMGLSEWVWGDDEDEFASDSETSPDSPHFQYLLSKWTVYKFDNHPALQYEDNPRDGLVLVREFGLRYYYVEDALMSGNIENLISQGWWETHEKFYSFSEKDTDLKESFNPRYEEDDGISEYDTYKWYKELKRFYCDPEKFDYQLRSIDWDFVSDFWYVGIIHDSIDFAPAGITAILLKSGKLRFTDAELEYLIDYASKSGKIEHTACLLNYKNERRN